MDAVDTAGTLSLFLAFTSGGGSCADARLEGDGRVASGGRDNIAGAARLLRVPNCDAP